MTTTAYQLVDCPKCDGKGFIQAFGHVANGDCFCCNGAKKLRVTKEDVERSMSADNVKKAEWIMNATVEQFAKLTPAQLEKARNFCHWHYLPYPNLLDVWYAKGETFYQEVQERRREELSQFAL